MTKPKAIILYSSGLDSTTCLAAAVKDGFDAYALSFDYGQRHQIELQKACQYATQVGASQHLVMKIDLRAVGGSALTSDIAVPKSRNIDTEIPITYVPARNTVFLSFALAWAEVLGAFDIFIGVNALDYSGYPDCRPEFIEAFSRMANLATKAAVEGDRTYTIHTPLLHLSKADIIRMGSDLGVDYAMTHSCYDPSPEGLSCGQCDSCQLRLKGFANAGMADPIPYQN